MELKASGISRRYFRKGRGTNVFEAVKTTDLDLTPGALTEIFGRSGSGKSTLLNMLAGLMEPTAGEVLLDGVSLYKLDDEERSRLRNEKLGVMTQSHAALSSLTVKENVLLPRAMYGLTDDDALAEELMERLGISALRDVYPNELSGGELRRLSIARALIMRPGIVLADEPTGDLDDENTETVLSLLKELAANGAAVLLVTHERGAERFADLIYDMSGGVLTKQ